jgi:molybdopterin-guanine dinucleotide biosynthesis protein A
MSAYPQVAAVIMAGGKNSRFGELSQAQPKCLLRLPDNETLLGRLLKQLRVAGISNTVVCCSDENFSLIHSFLCQYRARAGISDKEVEGAACARCRAGPLPALAEALSQVRAQWYLLCLADIVFAAEPFAKAMEQLSLSDSGTVALGSGLDGLLISGIDQLRPDGTGSGFVKCEQKAVRAISYKAFGAKDSWGESCRHWSGAFLFRATLLSDGRNDPGQHGTAPFENWIQQLLENGAHCEWTDGGSFFNVNTRKDYEAMQAFRKWND